MPMEGENVPKKGSPKPSYKQTIIVATILTLTFLSQANTGKKEYHYVSMLVAAVLFSLVVILTAYKGRKMLFTSLLVLSSLSCIAFLKGLTSVGDALQTAVRGATVVLTGVVLCEYSEPKHRIVHLIINSAVLRLSCWAYTMYAFNDNDFDGYLQLFKFALGVVCLASVLTWPESPYWLASKGRFEEAKMAFSIVRSEDQRTAEELQTLTETEQRRGSPKMILAPLLVGLPVILALASNFVYLELQCIMEAISLVSNKMWLYFIFNIFVSAVYIYAAFKLSRKRLLIVSSLIAIVVMSLVFLVDYFPITPVPAAEGFLFFIGYLVVVGVFTSIHYPIAIEMIAGKYITVISGILGLTYIIGEFCYVSLYDTFIMLIALCFVVNPIAAYLVLPETKDKSMIEIEQEYRLKQVQREQSDL